MRGPVLRALRSVAAVLAGYAVIVAGTTLAFETLLGGIGYYKSSGTVLAIASVAAFVVGFCRQKKTTCFIHRRHPNIAEPTPPLSLPQNPAASRRSSPDTR